MDRKRHLLQLYSALLYNAHLKGFAKGKIFEGPTKGVCVPGLNCYSCPGAVMACPLGSLQNALSSLDKSALFYVAGIILLSGVLCGRTICGWLCPFGFLQELLHKIPVPKIKKSRITRALSYLKYVILAVFAVAIPLCIGIGKGISVPAFCKYICPAGTLEGALLLLPKNPDLLSLLGVLFREKLVILIVVIVLCVFCYRAFCRFLCPLGALYGLFNRIAVIGVKVDRDRCNGCGACVRNCKMDVKRVGDHECIHCGNCVSDCAQDAIAMRAGKKIIRIPKKLLWGILGAALLALLIWANFIDKSTDAASGETVSVMESLETLPDLEAKCLDGSTFRLSDQAGKPVIINLWATWCGPCVKELPYFNKFYQEHPDAAVLAIHSGLVTEDVEAFLADKDWEFPITIDSEDEKLFGMLGGSQVLPQTIVINRNGEVIYNDSVSMTPEKLEELYEEAMK